MTFEELLISKGGTCSTCGNSFSDQNPPQVVELANKTFNGKPVVVAFCRNPPFIHSHSKKQQETIKVVYQASGKGFTTIMYKSLDKKSVPKCPTCGGPIIK